MKAKKLQYHFIVLLFIFSNLGLFSQNNSIHNIKLDFGKKACATNTYNDFKLKFDFTGFYHATNVFKVELSDAEGNFDNPIVIGQVTGKNEQFYEVETSLKFPTNTYGGNYAIRIHATNPDVFSEPITGIQAYYRDLTKEIVLNNKENVSLCSGSKKIEAVYPLAGAKFRWYKNDVEIKGVSSSSYTITESGRYYVRLEMGECTDSDTGNPASNEVIVSLVDSDFKIVSSSNSTSICKGQTINLSVQSSTGNENNFSFIWSKDGAEIGTGTTIDVSEVGKYRVAIQGQGCDSVLETNVVLFDSSALKTNPKSILVLKEGTENKIEASGAEAYEWYDSKGNLLSSTAILKVDDVGTYTLKAKVGECRVEKNIRVVIDDGKNFVQNILSPDGDGVNDKWELPNKFAFNPDVQVIIYDTAGNELLNTVNYQNNWPEKNTEIKNQMLLYYKIIKNETLIKAGTISIIR